MKKKVLLFVQDGVGGAERMTAMIGRNLNKDRYEICFCLIERTVKSSIIDFIPSNIRCVRIKNNGVCSLIANIAWTLKRENPDVVFSSVFNISNKLLLLKWILPHTMFIVRCDNYIYTYSERQRKMLKRIYPKADVLIAQTEEMGEELTIQAGIKAEKVVVLHNPIDKFLIDAKMKEGVTPYTNNDLKHFVAVGRFNHQKGFDLLIEAFINVTRKRNDVDLHIVGDTTVGKGEVAEFVMERAKKAGISDLVHFYGYQENPYPYIKYANCFVLSSRWEGLPNVLIEALYLATPVAAFKCIPIIERIVNDGVDGVLAEKEDVDALSNAMMKAVDFGRISARYKGASITNFTELFNLKYKDFYKQRISGGDRNRLKFILREDFLAYGMKHPLISRFTYGENWELFSFLRTIRYLEYYSCNKKNVWQKLMVLYYWLQYRKKCKANHIFININSVGPGFHLVHRGFRHILGTTKIGANCTILPNVLIGKKTPDMEDCRINIGDDCYIGTGVTILGPVVIGNNVTIAAGAVVTKDIPDNCVVAGVPAQIVKYKI